MLRVGIAMLVLVALASACSRKNDQLVEVPSDVRVSPSQIDFGEVYLRAHPSRTLTVANLGEAHETVVVTLPGGSPFSLEVGSRSLDGNESVGIPVTFSPSVVGDDDATIHLEWSSGSADVHVSGRALEWPTCTSSGDGCQQSTFDPDRGVCRTTNAPDGTACDGNNCLVHASCSSGRCVGEFADCDDDNACTLDSCVPGVGCQHQLNDAACKSDDPCQTAWCDPLSGCKSEPAPDGTLCGADNDCQAVGICQQGLCSQARAPDGTPCHLSWALCATDATCQAGQCDSPTADSWQKGQVLWQYDPDAGSTPYREIQAVDKDGNSYGSDIVNGGLFSLDICGHERWLQPDVPLPQAAMLSGDKLIVTTNGLVEARSAATGQLIWQFDAAQLFGYCPDGGPCGATMNSYFFGTPLALSNQGQILMSTLTPTAPYVLLVGSLDLNGNLQWFSEAGAMEVEYWGADKVVDQVGNLYLYSQDQWMTSLDLQGHIRFNVPSYAQTNLAVGPNFVLDLGSNPTTAWTFSGSQDYVVAPQVVQSPQFSSTGVIDASGATIFWPGAASTSTPGPVRISAAGDLLASLLIPGFPMAELTLDDSGRVYILGIDGSEDFTVWCWDGHSPSLDWSAKIIHVFDNHQRQRPNAYNLFVSHGTLLIGIDNVIEALFIGQHGEATQVPWSRGYGGENENRRSPPLLPIAIPNP
jgi:hypothetical protein